MAVPVVIPRDELEAAALTRRDETGDPRAQPPAARRRRTGLERPADRGQPLVQAGQPGTRPPTRERDAAGGGPVLDLDDERLTIPRTATSTAAPDE